MPLPLIPILAGAGVAAYLLFSGKSGSSTSIFGGGTAPAPSPYTPPSGGGGGGGGGTSPGGGGGGGSTGPLQPGQYDPAGGGTYLGPGGSNVPLPQNYDPTSGQPNTSGDSTYLSPGGANELPQTSPVADSGGGGSWWDSLWSSSGTVGHPWHVRYDQHGTPFVWCTAPSVLAATGGRGGWVPHYDGYDYGAPPPPGLPIH
jgi:hypothetical protein